MRSSTRKATTRHLAGAVAAVAALTLAACSAGGEAAGGSKSLEIFSYWTNGSEAKGLGAMIDDFKKQNPGVNVTNAAVSGDGGLNAQAALQARLAGGNPPDTWQTAPMFGVTQYSDANLLADLTPLYQKNDWSKVIPADIIDAVSADGKIYGAVTNVHRSNALWYNAKVIKDAGIDPTSLKSFNDLVALKGKLDAKGISTLCIGNSDGYGSRVLFENVLFAYLGVQGYKDLFAGKTAWDDPKVVAAVQTYVDSIPAWSRDNQSLAWHDATQALGEGKCAFESMGDWAYGELQTMGFAYKKDFDYVEFPGSAGTFLANADLFVVSNKAKDPDNALKWVETANSAQAQVDFSRLKGSVPVRSDADVSSLPEYQQQTAKLLQTEKRSYSFQQGAMAPAAYVRAFSDALIQLNNNPGKIADFIAAMKSTAANK
jgi:glucose/mannose transport system substrate-binding protein